MRHLSVTIPGAALDPPLSLHVHVVGTVHHDLGETCSATLAGRSNTAATKILLRVPRNDDALGKLTSQGRSLAQAPPATTR
jgi:hypothetical protein